MKAIIKSSNIENCYTMNDTVGEQTALNNRINSINAYDAYTSTESALNEYPKTATASITVTGIIKGSISNLSISNTKLLSPNALLCKVSIGTASLGIANIQLTVNGVVKHVKCSTLSSPIGNLYGSEYRPSNRLCLFMDNKLVFSGISSTTTFDMIIYF